MRGQARSLCQGRGLSLLGFAAPATLIIVMTASAATLGAITRFGPG